ncbi:uncharacterized protein LOC110669300 isoform X2 [Hevea brasiliensis]|uniref:uncharacterized protein LOC110669300 isoform X2 n=1 Tax=Hevea brasiliensis TaxID=3981 RepID=UPI0025FED4FB|nr:uncharacterized protein LOC110669300 isoform X2 [Hevea brasiliensis]
MDQLESKAESDIFKKDTIASTETLGVDTEEYETSFKRTKTMSKVWDVFEKLPMLPNGGLKAICCPVINPCRNSLKQKTIQALICLQDWLQPLDTAGQSTSLESLPDDDDSSSNDAIDDDDAN